MKITDVPANVSLLVPTDDRIKALRPTKVLDIFDGGNINNFHEDGLFSVTTFGRVGSDDRDSKFSYIDLRTEILHPYIYKCLLKLRGFYGEIMGGKAFAVWDDEIKDFVVSDALNGETGYAFFFGKWKEIVFKGTGSDVRDLRIKLITKFKDRATTNRVLIIPAGLRDVQIDKDGRVKEGEINDFYRGLISISNTISNIAGNSPVLDNSRFAMQRKFNDIFEYILSLLEGKGGFFQEKWGARRIFYGTRNVLTAMDTSAAVLDELNSPSVNQTMVGLYQVMKGALPKTMHWLMTGWLSKVFQGRQGEAILVNPTTLHREFVSLDSDTMDRWTTTSGLEKVVNGYSDPSNRSKPVMIGKHYIGLVYRGPDKTFKIFNDIDDLPRDGNFKKENVYPITLCELLYLSGYREWNKLAAFVTRYPIGQGHSSIYACYIYVKNTIVGQIRYELGEDWEKIGEEYCALEYPVFGDNPVYLDSLVPHTSKIEGMVGDYDGDTGSFNVVFTDESLEEVAKNLSKVSAYLNTRNGGLLSSPMVDTVKRVIFNMTGD